MRYHKTAEDFLFSNDVAVCGVDFDGTLTIFDKEGVTKNPDGIYNYPNCEPNHRIIEMVNRLIRCGKKVHIVTFRDHPFVQEVIDFCKEHNIKVESVINTCGQSKIKPLEDIKADCHIDDDLGVCLGLFMSDIEPVLIVDSENKKNSSHEIIVYKL